MIRYVKNMIKKLDGMKIELQQTLDMLPGDFNL